MWHIISSHVDFKNKSILDLGCGYGDLVMYAADANARFVVGIEHKPSIVYALRERIRASGVAEDVSIMILHGNIDEWESRWQNFDIIICTSVLPYLKNPDRLLENMSRHGDVVVIECQYAGDGPGFAHIKNDDDMRIWLLMYWRHVEKIGSTDIIDRGASRSIWMCKNH